MPFIPLRSDLYGITSLLDYRKDAARPLCELTDILLHGPSSLTEAERELIAAYVSYRNECAFCFSAHSAVTCASAGGKEEWIEQMKVDSSTITVSEKMHALLEIAGKVQISGSAVQQVDIDAAKNLGATDLEIHDTVLIAALFCLYNRYVDGLQTSTPTDPEFYKALGKRIAGRGYAMPEDGYHRLQYKENT